MKPILIITMPALVPALHPRAKREKKRHEVERDKLLAKFKGCGIETIMIEQQGAPITMRLLHDGSLKVEDLITEKP